MTFDEWWDSTQPKPSEDMCGVIAPLRFYAKMGWDAAKQSVVDELNLSIKEAWPDEDQPNDAT